jgi:hypothetical protein
MPIGNSNLPTGEDLLADTLYEHTDNITSHSSSPEAQWPKVFNFQYQRGQILGSQHECKHIPSIPLMSQSTCYLEIV